MPIDFSTRGPGWPRPFFVTLLQGLGLGILLGLGLVACSEEKSPAPEPLAPELSTEARIKRMIASEELVQKLTPKLRALGASMVRGSRDDLPEALAEEASVAPWEGLEPAHRWTSASFGTLAASFQNGSFEMHTTFEGVRRGEDGAIVGVTAKQKLIWKKSDDTEGGWKLVKWEPLDFATDESPQALFEEVLNRVIPDTDALATAQTSYQEEVLRKTFAGETAKVGRFQVTSSPDIESGQQYPTVSVMDYDSDGHEDFFLSARWVPPQLFRNRGDGTYEEVAAQSGLTVDSHVTAAVFADFDNDGDPDALLGRSFEPTQYYRNDEGRFTDVTATATDLGTLFVVSSMAVADVNGDGLLDVYLSTYNNPIARVKDINPGVLSREQVRKFAHILRTDSAPFLNERGFPNVLLMNRGGGRLERAGGEVVELWRKSYQPLWFDADNDGDEDLYVCNDFGPDSYLRNDTPRGAADPVLVDAFAEVFPDGKMAYGMGASCGDYDNDGDLDLFVSNMYSKAGNRIVPAFENTDPRILAAARGNFLYRNDGGLFQLVNEADAPETKVGWAFGGQFADFNNDGWQDLYVPSGLYTAPKEVATEVDL
jgi:hypothetical protein